MTHKNRPLLMFFVIALALSGCVKDEPTKVVEKIRQVSVATVEYEAFKETIRYTGFVSASQIIPMSFATDGMVDEVKVKEGQKVKFGDALVTLMKTGTDADATGTLYAGMNGIVAEVVNKPGDLIGAGYPVVVLRTEELIMQVGVTDVDLIRIEDFGNPVVYVTFGDKKINATLKDLNHVPDETSRTYTVTITLEEDVDALIGQLGTISFELARMNGIWLPISQIQNDGEDYVYIVNIENRVERRTLKLKELNNDLIRVEGLDEEDRIITIGNSFVKEGQQVTAREDSNE